MKHDETWSMSSAFLPVNLSTCKVGIYAGRSVKKPAFTSHQVMVLGSTLSSYRVQGEGNEYPH